MNLQLVDWIIVALMLAGTTALTIYFRRFSRGVTDFMAASRMAGPYVLTLAPGLCGAVTLLAQCEATYNNGLSSGWWSTLGLPISMMLTLFGFVSYRLRQTKALTLSQFLEARYSRKFRFFAGILCWTSGVLNYGVMPMATGRAVICLFGLPDTFALGSWTIPTFPVVVFIFLAIACTIACVGGQVSILITGFFQSLFAYTAFLLVAYFMLYKFRWSTLMAGLRVVENPETQSLINPFKAFDADGFNIWFYVISILFNSYCRGCWQGGAGFNAAAKTPHAGVMAGVYARYRSYIVFLVMMLLPLAAYAVFHLPEFADFAAPMQEKLAQIGDVTARNQMRTPLFVAKILPAGLLGLFIAGIVGSTITGDDSYMHSWGTILVQDVIMPLRKKPFEPRRHLLYLRLGIIGVAVFSFLFSVFFPFKDFINMYFMITGAIYMGGAGAVVIGGLYWKRGSTPAAWTAMILGTVICLGGLLCQSFWDHLAPALHNAFPNWQYLTEHLDKFPIPSYIVTLATMVAAIGSYVAVSLLGPRHVHNMDKLLHRGEYAEDDTKEIAAPKFTWKRLVGISPQHTKLEQVLVGFSFAITMTMWVLFVVVTLLAIFTDRLTDNFWCELHFWKSIPLYVSIGTFTTIGLLCGGFKDAFELIKDLAHTKVNESDDGFVK